jgi:hypothetical protein
MHGSCGLCGGFIGDPFAVSESGEACREGASAEVKDIETPENEISAAFRGQPKRILVMTDDIDRLPKTR